MNTLIPLLLAKTTVILLLGITIAALLRTRSSTTRHFIWTLTLLGTLTIGIAAFVAPPVAVPVPLKPETIETITRSAVVPTAGPQASSPAQDGGETPPSQPARTPAFLPTLYVTGLLAVLAWMAVGHIGLARIAAATEEATDEWIRDTIARSGITRTVQVAFSASVSAPAAWGSVVLLPTEAAEWPLARKRAALLHELAHVARRDSLTQTIAGIICAVYWFHPLVWIALRRLRREGEHACDDFVIAGGAEPNEYASHLIDVARITRGRRLIAHAALDMARPSQLEGRVVAVLDGARTRNFASWRTRVAASTVILLLLVPFAAARPKDRAAKLRVSNDQRFHANTEDVATASPGQRLLLDLDAGGSVEIEGWDEPRVQVRAQRSEGTAIDVGHDDRGVRVHSKYESNVSSSSIRMQIRVPRRFDVQLESIGGGISIRQVEGTFEGNTAGGEIVLENVKGKADLTTGGGEIEVNDVDLAGHVSTGGGRVTFTHVRGGLGGSSGSGPFTYTKDDGAVHVEKAGGEIELDDVPRGASVSTGGGAIHIGSGAGLVEASTGGGSIRIGPIAGSVRATTGAGRVDITLSHAGGTAQSVEVFTGKGNVTIHLPPDYKGELDLESAYTEGLRRTQIESDWAVQKSETDTWDDREGTPRKYIRARGSAGSGGGRIRVRAVNGDVYVRRD